MNLALQQDSFFHAVAAQAAQLPLDAQPWSLRGYIDDVEWDLLQLPQVDVPLDHQLVGKLYTRTMRCPAGTALTGLVHRLPTLTILHSGDISVLTEHGATRLRGPMMFHSAAGIRRLGYAHTDVVWSTVAAVEGTTLDEIEAELFSLDYLEETR